MLALMLLLVVAVIAWPDDHRAEDVTAKIKQQEQLADLATPTKATATKKADTESALDQQDVDEFNPYESEVIKANIQQVADLYQESIKYPTGSQPVYDPAAVQEPEPFEQSEVDLPFPDGDDDQNPLRISAATENFQYFEGDIIRARVALINAPENAFANVTAVLSSSRGDVPLELNFAATNAALTTFSSEFDTNLAPPGSMSSEMLVKYTVQVAGRTLSTTSTFRYDIPSARVVAVFPARPDGPNLAIPLQLNVGQNGYYFVRGVLEDAQTNQPLIELQGEGRLQLGNAVFTLNAHIAALRRQGSEGPYLLRSIKLHRASEVGESSDQPGTSDQRSFQVQGFPFSAYQDEEFIDELGQERLDFLREVGSADQAETLQREREQQDRLVLEQQNPSLVDSQTN